MIVPIIVRRARSIPAPGLASFATRWCSSILRPIEPSTATALSRTGFACLDNVVLPSTSASLRAEIDSLADADLLRPNTTHLTRATGPTLTFPKANIHEAELNLLPDSLLSTLPTLGALREDTSLLTLLSVLFPRLTLREHAIKVQRADGHAACFPVHVDSAAGVDHRVVTALIYLNQDWNPKDHAGHLRLYPSPVQHHDLAPVDGRLVLLAATGMHHRVLPSFHRRFVITIWCSGTVRPEKPAARRAALDEDSLELRLVHTLLSPRFRDIAFRLTLVEEWERSLWQAHAPEVAERAVELHRANLSLIREKAPVALCQLLGDEARTLLPRLTALLADPSALLQLFKEVTAQDTTAAAFRW